jgi:peptide/nickel transport system substrate-binding protein
MLLKKLAAAAMAIAALVAPVAAQEFIAGIPRNEALIIQGPAAQNARQVSAPARVLGPTTPSAYRHRIPAR